MTRERLLLDGYSYMHRYRRNCSAHFIRLFVAWWVYIGHGEGSLIANKIALSEGQGVPSNAVSKLKHTFECTQHCGPDNPICSPAHTNGTPRREKEIHKSLSYNYFDDCGFGGGLCSTDGMLFVPCPQSVCISDPICVRCGR